MSINKKVSKRLNKLFCGKWDEAKTDKAFPLGNKTERTQRAKLVFDEIVEYFEANCDFFEEFRYDSENLSCYLVYDLGNHEFPPDEPCLESLTDEERQAMKFGLLLSVNYENESLDIGIKTIDTLKETKDAELYKQLFYVNKGCSCGAFSVNDERNLCFSIQLTYGVSDSASEMLDKRLPKLIAYAYSGISNVLIHLSMDDFFDKIPEGEKIHSTRLEDVLDNKHICKATKEMRAYRAFNEIKQYFAQNAKKLKGAMISEENAMIVFPYNFTRKNHLVMTTVNECEETVNILVPLGICCSTRTKSNMCRALNEINRRIEVGNFVMASKDNTVCYMLNYLYGDSNIADTYEKNLSHALEIAFVYSDKFKFAAEGKS